MGMRNESLLIWYVRMYMQSGRHPPPQTQKRTPLSSQGAVPLSHLLAIQSGGGFQGQRQMRGSV